MDGHHLILGEIVDYLSGETLEDTHDERYRQRIARFLVEEKGYAKKEISSRYELIAKANNKRAVMKIDFLIRLKNRTCMIIKYSPGSLVTRHRLSLAASRLAAPYQIPVVVVTNGIEADILSGKTGRLLASGFQAIPSRDELIRKVSENPFEIISSIRAEKESRILYAFEVDDACPCDDSICKIPDNGSNE